MASALATCRVYSPSAEALAHRAHIASKLASLRTPTVKVPFWKLAAHRIPTLWTLYRGLLVNAPAEIIRTRIRWEFVRLRHLTSPAKTRDHLRRLYKWMDIFRQAKLGDTRVQAIVTRYTSMLEARKDKDIFADILRKEMAWQERLRTRPMVTGSIIPATLYNKPLPRLKPQPINITGIIVSRHRKRAVRQQQMEDLSELINDLKRECEFETALEKQGGLEIEKVISNSAPEMKKHINARLKTIYKSFSLDKERLMTPRSPELLEIVRKARQRKGENKRRERLREERGEVLPITLRRARKRPPPHVLSKMTEEQKRLDAISRSSVSEVGYIGYVKKKLGFKLRDPDSWKVEDGDPKNREALDKLEAEIRAENERRRKAAEAEETDVEDPKAGN